LTSAERLNAFFTIGVDGHRMMLEREPIYQQLRVGLGNLMKSIGLASKKDSGNWILALIAIVAILSISGASVVLGYALAAYAIYYCLWFFGHVTPQDLPGSNKVASVSPTSLQETAEYPTATMRAEPVIETRKARVAVSAKEAKRVWKAEQQQALSHRDFWNSSHTWLQSMTFSGLVAAVASIAGGFIAVSNGYLSGSIGNWNSHALGAIAWLGSMSILSSWVVVTFARRWESRHEDSIAFRFALMVAGLMLGAASFQLSEFLLIPWRSILNPEADFNAKVFDGDFNRFLKGFYDQDQMPNLAGHMAYFAGLMWIVRWWRQSDSLRKKKFSLWAVVWSMLMAGLVQAIFFFPSPWCLWMAGIVSLSVQIASPWIDPNVPQIGQPQLAQARPRGNNART
jgi:hypothetical protein